MEIKDFKSRYWDVTESLDYLVETCSECDGEFFGDKIKAFLHEVFSLVGGNANE